MEEIRNELEEINLKIYRLRNLIKLLEDYFYGVPDKDEYAKNQSLCDVIAEKVVSIDEEMQKLYKKALEIERN